MKVLEAKSRRYVGRKCRACPRQIRKGQAIMVDQIATAHFAERDYVVHVECMSRLVATAPPSRDERAFEALRERIIESGSAFPRVL